MLLVDDDGRNPEVDPDSLAESLRVGEPSHASGALGSAAALVARALLRRARSVVWISADAELATRAAQDAAFYADEGTRLASLPSYEQSPWAEVAPDRRAAQARLAALAELASDAPPRLLTLPASALLRKVVPLALVRSQSRRIAVDADLDRDAFARALVEAGYLRSPLVEDPGCFAIRGALLDLWSPTSPKPVRVELYGDAVLSIKEFDPDDQRSLRELDEVVVAPAREAPSGADFVARARERLRDLCDSIDLASSKTRALIDDVVGGRSFLGADGYLPAFVELVGLEAYLARDAVVLVEDPGTVVAELRAGLARAREERARRGREPVFDEASFYVDTQALERFFAERRVLCLHHGAVTATGPLEGLAKLELAPEGLPSLGVSDHAALERAIRGMRHERGHGQTLDPLVAQLGLWSEEGLSTALVARTHAQAERLASLLSHRSIQLELAQDGLPAGYLDDPSKRPPLLVTTGPLARGLAAPRAGFCLVTEEEIFGTRSERRAKRASERSSSSKARVFLEDLRSLAPGDFVVHVEHGIGRYLGLVHREISGVRLDLIHLEYAGGDKLYLPVYRLSQLEKYAGQEATPKLHRLGGQSFAKSKARAAREVRKMADELLKLYAERRAATREQLPPVDDEYRAFEATFPFEETPDQLQAIEDVERDLALGTPMDRLVCGDVGFGKTEVAMRAAFRVANAGRQVAVLCPTTVLALQHHQSFAQRMSAWPVTVKSLSRFSTKAEQDAVLKGLKDGTVDVVIGTHRLLSKDVHYKRLGLLVVDEEQRFGVTHKERIKQIRSKVDVLTLSATPIPRTLQMAVTGLRDMSIITTPPVDRRAIRTIVTKHDEASIRVAVERELDRGGQVFYVHNRVEALYERAQRLKELVPRARIAVAHGQMSEAALEQTMVDFVEGEYDVLCATAIIESGLDIPRANTIIVDRADLFGLAQLYQLRGRVGRARERAYCYLVVPPPSAMTDEARARIDALERHTELGSGFQIASLDLELRGAGDLLGAEQSGTAAQVGFETFCRMLDEAVHELRGEPVRHEIDPELSVDEEALLPDDYVDDIGVRLSLYKRLASAEGDGEIDELAIEMEDRFGPAPEATKRLVKLMRLKVELRRLRALGCEATRRSVTVHLADDTPISTDKLLALVQGSRGAYKLSPDMRLSCRFAEGQTTGGLDAMEQTLTALARTLPGG